MANNKLELKVHQTCNQAWVPATMVEERQDAQTNLLDTHILKRCLVAIRKTSEITWRAHWWLESRRPSTLKKKQKSLTHIEWNPVLKIKRHIRDILLWCPRKNWESMTIHTSQSLVSPHTRKASQTGRMAIMTSSMRSSHSIHFILCHSKVSPATSKVLLKNSNADYASTMICLNLLVIKDSRQCSGWANTNQWVLILKRLTKKHTKDLSLLVDLSSKPRKYKQYILELCQLILTLPIRRISFNTRLR